MFTNLRYRKTSNDYYVNTPKVEKCIIQPADEFEGPLADVEDSNTILTEDALLMGVISSSKTLTCIACRRNVTPTDDIFGQCQNSRCQLIQRLQNCNITVYT